MDIYLYLIEILIQEIVQNEKDIDKLDVNVDVKLGSLNDINVHLGEKPDVSTDVKLLNPGKSYLFPSSSCALKHQMLESEIKFTVKYASDPNNIIGETIMKWPASFYELVERSEEKNLLPESVTETLRFSNNDGHIKVFMRLSCFGNDIQTQYQVMQTRDEKMSYLFKDSKVPVAFQSPDYGKGGVNDLLPVGPLYSPTRDRRQKSNYSLDMTVSEIEANLCNKEDCLAAYKFQKYGIGPLVKQPTLSTNNTEEESTLKQFSCEKLEKKVPCCNGHLKAGNVEKNQNYYGTEDTQIHKQKCCGKRNCKNRKICKNQNCKNNQINQANYNNLNAIICDDCGGYSISGKTCKDLKTSSILNADLKIPDEIVHINNVKCFCEPDCDKLHILHSKTTSDKNAIVTIKSEMFESFEKSMIPQKNNCSKNQRLRSGANTTLLKEKSSDKLKSRTLENVEQFKSKKRRTNLVYNIGDTYPGKHYGHKTCTDTTPNVPWKKGWQWSPEPVIFPFKPRKEYRPGFISKEIQEIINRTREKAGLPILVAKPHKKKKKKLFGSRVSATKYQEDDDEADEYEVEDKKTLYFNKKAGTYYISMNPLRDPNHVQDNEDPYINCPPIKIKYTEDPSKQMIKKYDANCDCSICDSSNDDESEDDELNLEFSPPRGVVEMDRMVKAPNVSHISTQYDSIDLIESVWKAPKIKFK